VRSNRAVPTAMPRQDRSMLALLLPAQKKNGVELLAQDQRRAKNSFRGIVVGRQLGGARSGGKSFKQCRERLVGCKSCRIAALDSVPCKDGVTL